MPYVDVFGILSSLFLPIQHHMYGAVVVLEHDIALHVYPFPCIKYSLHNTGLVISLTLIILLSIDIFPLVFCFHGPLVMARSPGYIIPPVCPRKSLCVKNYASTLHFITERLSVLRFRLTPNVPLIYFITCCSFPQSSSSIAFTLVVRKSTSVCKP